MKLSEIELPSNRKFGFFFTGIFLLLGGYFYYIKWVLAAYVLGGLSLVLLLVTLIRADALLPLNKLWMRFGLLLGMIVNPIVMGIIYFGLFTPISIITRLLGRDELRIRFEEKDTHWISRPPADVRSDAFKYQF
jgi:hypothetical protein